MNLWLFPEHDETAQKSISHGAPPHLTKQPEVRL